MKEENKERLARGGLQALVGALWGTIDVLASGYPILTAGIPVWEAIKFFNAKGWFESRGVDLEIDNIEYLLGILKSLPAYALGATIPFSIKYNQEIYNFLSNLTN